MLARMANYIGLFQAHCCIPMQVLCAYVVPMRIMLRCLVVALVWKTPFRKRGKSEIEGAPSCIRPSEINEAVKTITAGVKSKKELATALTNFNIGKEMYKAAEDATIRHGDDCIGDASLSAGQSLLAALAVDPSTIGKLSFADAHPIVQAVGPISIKMHGAFIKWSDLRAEEQAPSSLALINELGGLCMASCSALVRHLVSSLFDPVQKVETMVDEHRDSPPDVFQASLAPLVQEMAKCVNGMMGEVSGFCTKLDAALSAVVKLSLASKGLEKKDVDIIVQSSTTLQEVNYAWMAWMLCCKAMYALLVHNASDPLVGRWFDLEKAFEDNRLVNDGIVSFEWQRLEAKCSQPAMFLALQYATLRRFLETSQKLPSSMVANKFLEESQRAQADVEIVRGHICVSDLAAHVLSKVCFTEVLGSGLGRFLESMQLSAMRSSTVESIKKASPGSVLAMLIGSGWHDNLIAAAQGSLPGGHMRKDQLAALQHSVEVESLKRMVAELLGDNFAVIESWNEPSTTRGDGDGLSASAISQLADLYCIMYTLMLVMNMVGKYILSEPSLVDLPNAANVKQANANFGFKLEVLDIWKTLCTTVEEATMVANSFGDDTSSFGNLRYQVLVCHQWVVASQAFAEATAKRMLSDSHHNLQKIVNQLEAAVPRWEGVITEDGQINEPFAKSRLLAHPQRPLVRPYAKFLKNLLEQTKKEVLPSPFNLDFSSEDFKSPETLIETTTKVADNYLLIIAALNAVLVKRTKEVQAAMSTNVLSIAKNIESKNNFKLPAVLTAKMIDMGGGGPSPRRRRRRRPSPSAALLVKRTHRQLCRPHRLASRATSPRQPAEPPGQARIARRVRPPRPPAAVATAATTARPPASPLDP